MAFNAGDIVFRIMGKDEGLTAALDKAKGQFATASKAMGAAMTAVGGTITAFVGKSVHDFAQLGDELDKMSGRTGFSTNALGELKYAAEQSGATLNDVEKASRKLSQTLFEAGLESEKVGEKQQGAFEKGSAAVLKAENQVKASIQAVYNIQQQIASGQLGLQDKLLKAQQKAQEAAQKYNETIATQNKRVSEAGEGTGRYSELLSKLGLDYNALKSLNPEQQFLTVAYAIADVNDESMRAALAVNIFGKSGTQLLPMLAQGRAGVEALRAEAVRLGYSLNKDATDSAVEFGDRMQDAGLALRSLSLEVAQVLLPELTALAIWVKEAAISFREWRQEHPELVANLTKLTTGVGALMFALGPLIIALPGLVTAWGLVKGAIVAVMAVFTAIGGTISAPVALIIAAVAAIGLAAYGIWKDWDNVKGLLIRTWEALKNAFELIFAPVIAAWKMIQNAVGYTPTGALNQGALDRYRNGIQASTGLGRSGGGTYNGGGMRDAPANAGVGLAGVGGVTIQNMTIVTDDPKEASRTLAESLELELRGRGLLYG